MVNSPAPVAERARKVLARLAGGRVAQAPLTIRFWDGSELRAREQSQAAPALVLRRPEALAHLLRAPNQIGLARAWVDGSLELDGELERVLALRERYRDLRLSAAQRLLLAVAAVRAAGANVLRRPPVPAIEARPRGLRHSRRRDRRAVTHHYEISNRFYELLLGPTLVYSCAYFEDPAESLELAQTRKLETIC